PPSPPLFPYTPLFRSLEGRLEHRGTRPADAFRVCQAHRLRVAAGILRDGEETRHAPALLVLAAHEVAGSFGRDHEDVHVGGRDRSEEHTSELQSRFDL